MIDWRLGEAQRAAQTKRRQLEALDEQLRNMETLLSEAQAFESEYEQRIGDVERQISAIVPGYSLYGGIVRAGDPSRAGELGPLRDQLAALIGERDRALAARRVQAVDPISRDRSWSPLCSAQVDARLMNLRIVRAMAANELDEIESKLSPGELVQSGVPAGDYSDHRERVARLRQSVGGAA